MRPTLTKMMMMSHETPPPPTLTVFGLQLGAGLRRHQAGHEAVVTLRAGAALHRRRRADRGADARPRDD